MLNLIFAKIHFFLKTISRKKNRPRKGGTVQSYETEYYVFNEAFLELYFVDELVVGLEVQEAHVFPFLCEEEEAFALPCEDLVGDFVFDVKGVELFDFIARMQLLEF